MVRKRKSPLLYSRGQEIPVVPPQFTALRRPHGGQTAPRAVPGSPVRAYFQFSPATPKGIPHSGHTALHPPAALWETFELCTDFLQCVVYVFFCIFNSIPLPASQVNKKTQIFSCKIQMFFAETTDPLPGFAQQGVFARRTNVHPDVVCFHDFAEKFLFGAIKYLHYLRSLLNL